LEIASSSALSEMDPLGAISLAIELTQGLVWYIKSANARHEDKNKLLVEICASRGTLDGLSEALRQEGSGLEMTRGLLGENSLIDELRKILENMTKEFEEQPGRKKSEHDNWFRKGLHGGKDAIKVVVWPFKKESLDAHVEEMARLRQALVAAMIADTAIKSPAIGRIERQVDRVVRTQVNSERREKRERILRRLNVPGVATALRDDARFRRSHGTNDWFLEGKEFMDWLNTPGMVLWLTGKPGCGKSTLCRTVIRWLHDHRRAESAVIHILFDDIDSKHSQSAAILRSIVKQAIEQQSDIPEVILGLDDWMQDDLEEMYGGFAEASRTIMRKFDQVFLVVDGLEDKAEGGDLDWLRKISSPPSNLNVIISRTQGLLEHYQFAHREVRVIDLDQRLEVEEDIKSYITERLESDSSLCKWPADIQKEMKDCLIERACGT
jgi:hypothetical protein